MISAVVLTKNEEKNIEDCLNSLEWCDEIIVIDDQSADKTVELAKHLGAKVFAQPLGNDFASQRNFGLKKASHKWVLFIDADERISGSLRNEILTHLSSKTNSSNGFYFKRIDVMWGRQLRYGETGNIQLLRLAKKNAGKWEGKIHERWNITGKTTILENPLMHYPHPTIREFLEDINFYTTIRAQELFEKKVRVHFLDIVLYSKGKFFMNYILKQGFRDGIPGIIGAIMMSFHSFLVRAKLWSLYDKKT